MATLLIEDLKESVELDREAMRTIVGAGKPVAWSRQQPQLLLVAVSAGRAGATCGGDAVVDVSSSRRLWKR